VGLAAVHRCLIERSGVDGGLGEVGQRGLRQHGLIGEDRRGNGLLGAALARDEDADALEDLGRGAGTLGQEDVGAVGAVEGVDGTRDNHGG